MHPKVSLTLRLFFFLCLIAMVGNDRAQAIPPQQEQSPLSKELYTSSSYEGLETLAYLPLERSTNSPQAPGLALEPWQQVVFESYRDLDWEIYLLDSSGSQKRLTYTVGPDIHPRLSRGCNRIYFASKRTGNYDIFAMNPDGSGLVQLTTNRKDDVYPIPSPDGSRILFQSYRQGKADLYLMNADGTGQTPLIDDGLYNGMPAWSPDGSKIAFISRRSGGFYVHVVNADGSGLTQLSKQIYSYYPAWSPDGGKIAYSADSDTNQWLELWLMNADGTGQTRLLSPANYTDHLSRSWSPDGRYITFTEVNYEYTGGNMYLKTAFLSFWDTDIETSGKIIENGTEWNPDWQTVDITPPVATVQPLPATSPSPVLVSWPGADVGPAGIRDYDVQVKADPNGAWEDWLVGTLRTKAVYPGIEGHRYYFRVRATDASLNASAWSAETGAFTEIESAPPRSFVKPLPQYRRSGSLVEWQGVDPGGSGILSYDVQYKDLGGGGWVDWVLDSEQTSAFFPGAPAHTYAFRSRARDRAQNLESWPSGDGDTSTSVCHWAAVGKIVDHTGNPVSGARITITPGLPGGVLSETNGSYAACVDQSAGSYIVSIEKAGYGTPAPTIFSSQDDVPPIFTLPPDHNLVSNGDFESGSLEGSWQTGGDWPPGLDEEKNTGQYTARFAPPQETVYTQDNFPFMIGGNRVKILLDKNDLPNILVDNFQLDFMKRNPDGQWSAPETVPDSRNVRLEKALIDEHGNVHALWMNNGSLSGLVYSFRDPTGKWSSPVLLCSNPYWLERLSDMVIDRDGTLHFVWTVLENSKYSLNYVQRDTFGVWSIPVRVNQDRADTIKQVDLWADGTGSLHLSWLGTRSVYYAQGNTYGGWEVPEVVFSESAYVYIDLLRMAVTDAGDALLVWYARGQFGGSLDRRIFSSYHKRSQGWTEPELLKTEVGEWEDGMELIYDQDRRAHLVFPRQGHPGNLHFLWSEASSWGEPEILGDGYHAIFVEDPRGNLYAFWFSFEGFVTYQLWNQAGHWNEPQKLAGTSHYFRAVAVDQNGYCHLAWEGASSERILTYYGPRVESGGDTNLSQTITVPSGGPPAILSYLVKVVAPAGHLDGEHNWFDVSVEAGGQTTLLKRFNWSTGGWMQSWTDLSPWAGQTVKLVFSSHFRAGAYPSYTYLDEVSVGVAHPDVGVSAWSAPAGVKPGELVQIHLSVKNLSPALAESVTITAILDVGLSLVNSSLPPVVQGRNLVWTIDQLPPSGEPLIIAITARVDASALLGDKLIVTMAASPVSGELETDNNNASTVTYVGSIIYIPSILKD